MNFLSHIKKDKNGNIYYEKKLIKHIDGIRKIALKSLSKHLIEYKELLSKIVKLHDLGKYSKYFQDYLLTGKPAKNNLHFHSLIGACTIFNLLEKQNWSVPNVLDT